MGLRIKHNRRIWQELLPVRGHYFSRPMVLLQSDDWGLVGIRDLEGRQELKAGGWEIGNRPYDNYSLEKAEDLRLLFEVLRRHRDSVGRSPCLGFNFILSNVDFPRVRDSNFTRLHLMPLDEGLPGRWKRPGLLEAYREGIQRQLVYPGLHGLTHFSRASAERELYRKGRRGYLLKMLYRADTPMIPERTSWLGFEYRRGTDEYRTGWLDLATQGTLIAESKRIFARTFGMTPFSSCAPGYRANGDTLRAWKEAGVRVVQDGPGSPLPPHFDFRGLLRLPRNVPFEPFIEGEKHDETRALKSAGKVFRSGRPAILCIHSLNFHSTIKDQREKTLAKLDRFLSLLEARYEDLLYLNDFDLWGIIKKRKWEWNGVSSAIRVRTRFLPSPAMVYLSKRARNLLRGLETRAASRRGEAK